MTEPIPDPPAAQPPPVSDKKKKKKDKARAAWISFAGRIVAQVLGAVASVGLGLLVIQKVQSPKTPAAVAPAPRSDPQPVEPVRAAARREPGVIVLAVLPLDNFSGDAREDYFADGMTEALIADLAQLDGLRVISRTSSMSYKGRQKSLPQIAQELGVDLIVEGSVARAGDRVRVTAQLIDAQRDEHIWARSYERTLRDVLALQGEVATAIASEVKGAVAPRQQTRLTARKPVDPIVYDLYLRGRHAWNLRTPDGFQAAIRYFEQAIQKDPQFALAYAGLADTHSLAATPGEENPTARAKAAAERAIELDEGLAEAHTSLALVTQRQGDPAMADREFRRALELNPGYATAHQWYAILLAEEGRHDEATRHAQEAVALDPVSGTMQQTLGLTQYYGRKYDLVIAAERRALELAPHLPLARSLLARALVEEGQHAEAIRVCEEGGPPTSPELLGTLSLAHYRAGDRARSDVIQKSLLARDPVPAGALARLYAGKGDRAAALDMIEQMAARGVGLRQLKNDPMFDSLRTDARFVKALSRQSPQR